MAKKKASTKSKKTKPKKAENPAVRGLLILLSALILLLSLISFSFGQESQNWVGLVGYRIGWTFHALFGLASFFVPLFIGWIGLRLLFSKPLNNIISKTLSFCILVISMCMLLSLIEDRYPTIGNFFSASFYPTQWAHKLRFHLGGAPAFYFYRDLPSLNFFRVLNAPGVAIVFSTTLVCSSLFLFKIPPSIVLERLMRLISFVRSRFHREASPPEKLPIAPAIAPQKSKEESDFLRFVKLRIPEGSSLQSNPQAPDGSAPSPSQDLLAIRPETNLKVRPSLSRKEQRDDEPPQKGGPFSSHIVETPAPKPAPSPQRKREAALEAQRIHNGDFTAYQIPPASLLTPPKKVDQSTLKKDLKKQAEVLEETLQSFGIEAKVGQINCGPTITSFEVHPSIGVKVQKIKALENDIALNMEAKSIRIIAPIPGKAAVGIEVPNPQPQEVGFKDLLTAYQQNGRKFHIPILLGKAVNGDYVMSDLAKMPHCIIAGATGSGKSVCINTVIMAILLTAKPDEIKLVMVDPKKVELTPYSKLPHMLAPVITEPHGACAALNWLVKEMEKRYEILKLIGVRNIEGFNTRTINKEAEQQLDREIPDKMPFIVAIIDELADLMMVASSDIETPIARIAQMARAVGIHLILATQRPSREVITGLIKANFPTRISFKVASRVNSQIILDEIGAESLLGNGDMLFLPPGSSHLVRAQGAFIRDDDINAIVKFICDQAPPNYVISSFDQVGRLSSDALPGDEAATPSDPLYEQALDTILSTGNASTTFLQRKLKIGYARAASLMDQLEAQNIVGPAEGSKPRKILAASRKPAQDEDLPLDSTEDEMELELK